MKKYYYIELTWDGKIEKYVISTFNRKILWSYPPDPHNIFYWDSFLGKCVKAGEEVSDQQGKLIKLIGSNNKKDIIAEALVEVL